MRSHQWVLGGFVFVGLVACSSSDSSSASSSGSPPVTNGPANGGDGGPSGDGGAPGTDGGGESTSPGAWTTCTSSDALPVPTTFAYSRLAVAKEGTTVALYVAIGDAGAEVAIRRYTLSGSQGCALARDTTFGTGGELAKELGPSLVVDSTAAFWTLSDPTIARIHPTPLKCTLGGDLAGKFAHRFVLDSAGTKGFVQFEGDPHRIGKLIAGTSCAIDPLTLSGAPADDGYRERVYDLATDTSGRLHLAWGGAIGSPLGVEVYDAAGVFAKSYIPDPAHKAVDWLAACGTGICTLNHDGYERSFSRCDADGASCVSRPMTFPYDDAVYLAGSADARAFVFHVTDTKVEIVMAP